MIIVVLMAALIVPFFVDWDAYRSSFEREAEKIVGQPVHVAGSAHASLLPMPSLAFTDVRVGGTDDQPMMTIKRFALRIELTPLITGQIKVVEMSVDEPKLTVTVDDKGMPDWLKRSEASKSLDPDAVSLEKVDISDGSLFYRDTRSGRTIAFSGINASVDARSLLGPWKADGGAVVDGVPTTFHIATGRRGDDGTILLKVDANPASLPVAVSAEGQLGIDAEGLLWAGTFGLTSIAEDNTDATAATDQSAKSNPGWRVSGSYALRPDKLQLPAVTLSQGPEDRPFTLTGAATVDLESPVRFDASLTSRQIDIDRSVGKGPDNPANVVQVASAAATALGGLATPPIPGRIGFNLPVVVVGGSVLQNLRFDLSTSAKGWRIDGLGADLPGKTRLTADGIVKTSPEASFSGDVRLASNQPSILASWWRGGANAAEPLLQPFDMSGELDLAPGVVSISGIAAKMEDSDIRGSIDWRRGSDNKRDLAIDLKANRLDYDQLDSLARLFVGHGTADAGAIADGFQVKIATQTLDVGDVSMSDVGADGSFADGVLIANRMSIGNLAGAAVTASGRIADLTGAPNGQISASVDATDLSGSAAIVERLMPGSPVAAWFRAAAPQLGPAKIATVINARAEDGGTNASLTLNGTAGGTAIDAALGFAGTMDDWRDGTVKLSLAIDNDDAGHLIRQLGYDVSPLAKPGRARLTAEASGKPVSGVDTTAKGEFAGLDTELQGRIGVDANGAPTFEGSLTANGADASPALSLAGNSLPGLGEALPLSIATTLDLSGTSGKAVFQNAKFGPTQASGSLAVDRVNGRWKATGDLALDVADLGLLTGLALGVPSDPLAGAIGDGPWSKTTFSHPTIGGFDATLQLKADRLQLDPDLSIANARLTADYKSARTEIALVDGIFAGGKASGRLSIDNPEGQASVSAQFAVKGAALDNIVWQRGGRSVADGTFDLSGQIDGSGRSMAGVVSSLSGGGSLHIGPGSARFVNPQAFAAVIRAANAGKTFGEDELRALFAGYLDAGTLPFKQADGAFTITAGTLRAANMEVVSDSATTTGGVTIDLNDETIDSQWTLTVDPGADKVSGAVPQVGLVFSGPVDAPTRSVDVAPLVGFLSIRAFEREVERVEALQADVLEKDKLSRLVRYYRDEDRRRAEEAKQAAAAAAAKAAADQAAALAKAAADQAAAQAKADADRAAAAAKAAAEKAAAIAQAAAAKAAAQAKAAADKAAAAAAALAKLRDDQAKKAAADAAAREQQQLEKKIEQALKESAVPPPAEAPAEPPPQKPRKIVPDTTPAFDPNLLYPPGPIPPEPIPN